MLLVVIIYCFQPPDYLASQHDEALRTGLHHSRSICSEAEHIDMVHGTIQQEALPSLVFLTLLKIGEV